MSHNILTRRTLIPTIAAAAMAGAVISFASAATADPETDEIFVHVLDEQGIGYKTPAKAVAAGHLVCSALDEGLTPLQVVDLVQDESGLDNYNSGFFVGASIATYCPQHLDLVNEDGVIEP